MKAEEELSEERAIGTDNAEQSPEPAPAIYLARHEVLLAIAIALTPLTLEDDGFERWFMNFIILQVFAAVIVGVIWLFFTKWAKGKAMKGWIGLTWLLAGFWLLGQWT